MNGMKYLAAALLAVSLTAPAVAEMKTNSIGEAPSSGDDRIKCKRLSVTGSLTQGPKVCRTVREWREMRERNSDFARDMTDSFRTRPAGE